jgi:transposase
MGNLAKEYGRSKATIQSIIKKRKLTGTVRPQPRRGNPRILSEDQELRLIRHVRRKPKMRSAQMSLFMGVSASTCERILKRHGFRLRKCRPKPILSPKNIQDRLKWARKYEHQDWQQVIFTDEVAFQIGDDLKSEWCWRESNTENEENHLCIRKKKGKTLHVWGAVIHGKKIPLVRFALRPVRTVNKVKIAPDKIDGNVYLNQILSGPLKDAVAWSKANGREPIVLEDGAGPHKMKGFVEERASYGIINVEHPGASPDLNAIENCWAWVKSRIRKQPGHPSSLDQLWAAVQKAWDELPQSIVDGWIDDFEKRRLEVVAKNGHHTRF